MENINLHLNQEKIDEMINIKVADEDTNSILTDNANRAIQGNVTMQVTQSGDQLWN